jgi:glycine cleavage system aminomethyltransferase T
MAQSNDFGFGTQIRKSPYFDATVRWGAQAFSVYNHMYIPRDFGDPEQNFWNLVNDAILCDVAVERQVEITGPDAARFTQMLTPRDLSGMAVGQCKYILITNAEGGILNDPILLRLAENHFWISLADSDILLWAQGVAVHSGMDVTIREPDVSPLQLQGPKSGEVMKALFGESIMDLRYYWLREVELDGIPLIVSRTGWSSELGYELYLRDGSRGDELWETDHGRRARRSASSPAIPVPFAASRAGCCPITRMRISTPTPTSWASTGWSTSTWRPISSARLRCAAFEITG